MIVPVAFFAMIAAIVLVPQYLRHQERTRLQEVLRLAYEKGQPVPPDYLEAVTSRTPLRAPPAELPDRDLRLGVIWTAIAVGLVLVGAAFYAGLYEVGGARETFGTFAAMAAVPFCVGLGYLALFALGRRRRPV